jgi:hypothetical protein
LRLLISLIAVVLLAAGCGDSKKPADAPQPSHADYVRQADAACQRADAALASLTQPAGVAQLPSYARQAADIVAAERQELQALKVPDGDRAKADALAAAMDAVVDAAQGLVQVAGGGDAKEIEAYVAQHRSADAKAKQLANELGMTICAGS